MTNSPPLEFYANVFKTYTKASIRIFIFLCIFYGFPLELAAQKKTVPYLEREVSIVAQNKSIENILSDISTQAEFVFSYSPDIVHSNKKISLHMHKKPVRLVLQEIFNNDIEYKARSKYVILSKRAGSGNMKIESMLVEGYIYDSKTGEKLKEVSIYDKSLMVSTVSDEYGYFKMNLPSSKSVSDLRVSKAGYADTSMLPVIDESKLRSIELSLNAVDTVKDKKWLAFFNMEKIVPKWLIPKKIKINALNINDSVFKAVQFSIVPYVTTNHFLGGNSVNDFSFNCTVGYIKGVRRAEFGGIMNIVQDDAGYAQFAGFGNIVGGTFTGAQMGGTFNYASVVKGVQVSGAINLSGDATVQVAGIVNKATENNIQVSGAVNMAKHSNVQVTGAMNIAKDVNIQVAGAINQASNAEVFQISGAINNAKKNAALQIAGVLNHCSGTTEMQVTSLVNIAKKVKKFQIGLVNIADTCNGIPIGLVSIIKSGYHKIEISGNEVFPLNIAYRTGIKRLYSYFSLGVNPLKYSMPVWTYGYGIGTTFGKSDKPTFDLDVSFNPIIYRGNVGFDGMLNRIYFGMDKKLNPKMSLAFGLTYNVYIADTDNSGYNEVYSQIAPYMLSNSTLVTGTNIKTWIGGRIALRLF